LAAGLRSGRTGRRHRRRGSGSVNIGKLADMVMISDRPAEIEDRAVPGHWEGDLLIGKDGRSAIGTLVERSSRFVMLIALPHGRHAEQVRDALTAKVQQLPERLRRSITWDQGKEMAEHVQFTVDSGIQIYFCDPHAPWQQSGGCEASCARKARRRLTPITMTPATTTAIKPRMIQPTMTSLLVVWFSEPYSWTGTPQVADELLFARWRCGRPTASTAVPGGVRSLAADEGGNRRGVDHRPLCRGGRVDRCPDLGPPPT
jgi:hypothetical protein